MKARVIKSPRDNREWTVEIEHGVQSFRLDYSAPKKEAEWMAKMFRIALKAHDKERGEKRV